MSEIEDLVLIDELEKQASIPLGGHFFESGDAVMAMSSAALAKVISEMGGDSQAAMARACKAGKIDFYGSWVFRVQD